MLVFFAKQQKIVLQNISKQAIILRIHVFIDWHTSSSDIPGFPASLMAISACKIPQDAGYMHSFITIDET